MATIYNQKNDRDLVLACQRREPAAFEELVRRHQKMVYTLLFQLAPNWSDTAELSQEVFIRLWRSINSLRNPGALRPWLIRLVTNIFYEELRNRPSRLDSDLGEVDDTQGEAATESESKTNLEAQESGNNNHLKLGVDELVRRSLKGLPEPLRTPLVLRELEGIDYEEIAVLTRTEIGTVKARIAQARQKLQRILGPHLGTDFRSEVSA